MPQILDPRVFGNKDLQRVKGCIQKAGNFQFNDSVIINRMLWQAVQNYSPPFYADLNLMNLLIIGERYCGKTLWLLQAIINFLNQGFRVIVLDTCVEEGDIALTNVLIKGGIPQEKIIPSPVERSILSYNDLDFLEQNVTHYGFSTIFPLINISKPDIFIFDVSYYLERGLERGIGHTFEAYELHYRLIEQIILKIHWLSQSLKSPTVLITDEVRISERISKIFNIFYSNPINVVFSVHDVAYIVNTEQITKTSVFLSKPIYQNDTAIINLRLEKHVK